MSGSSLFYRDAAGNKQDASLHEDILAGGQHDPEFTRALAKSLGLSDTEIAALYGPLKPKSDALPQAE